MRRSSSSRSFRRPEPLNLGPQVNQPRGQEWSPYVSPDGRYFFFMSTRQPYPTDAPEALTRDWLLEFHAGSESGNPAIYWMDGGFIEELRARAFGSGDRAALFDHHGARPGPPGQLHELPLHLGRGEHGPGRDQLLILHLGH